MHVVLFLLQAETPETADKIDEFIEKMKKLLLLETPFDLVRYSYNYVTDISSLCKTV